MNTETPAVGRRIADRFELVAPFSDSYELYNVSAWRAIDTVLSRELRAVVIPHDHPHRALAIDAARKAGLFDDPHTCAVLAVVDDDADSVFFTEFPIGTRLDHHMDGNPLPVKQTTAIIGEIASVINHARHQGLRHLQLKASHVFISDAGELMLDGIATMAGLAGAPTDGLSTELDRSETRGLLVFYAALLSGQDFPDDPNAHQALIQSIAARADLPDRVHDVFQSEMIGQGPCSPADLLRRIVPWGDIDITLLPDVHPDADAQPSEPESSELESDAELYESAADGTPGTSESDESAAVDERASVHSDAPSPNAVDPDVEDNSLAGSGGNYDLEEGDHLTPQWPSPFDSLTSANESALTAAPNYTVRPDSADRDSADSQSDAISGTASDSHSSGSTAPRDDGTSADETHSDQPPLTTSSTVAATAARDATHVNDVTADLDSTTSGSSEPEGTDALSIPADFVGIEEVEASHERTAAIPFRELPSEAVVSTGSSHIRVSTAVIGLFAIGALIALVLGMMKLFSPLDPVQVMTPDADSSGQSQKTPDATGGSTQTPTPAVAVTPPQIESVAFVSADPNIKDNASAPRLFTDAPQAADGNPNTAFQSWFFTNPQLSDTDQFGLLIKFKEATDLSSITLTTTGEGGHIQWRSYDQAHPTGSDVIAQTAIGKSTTLTAAQKVHADYALIWVTEVPADQSGKNLLRVSEISVK